MYFEGIVEGPLWDSLLGTLYEKTASLLSFARCYWMRDRFIAKAIGCEIYRAIC